jgi:DNA-directed RNA polymerase specialized sigma24 family protein
MRPMNYTDDSDVALVGRHARGDADAFELLFRRHEIRTWHFLERNVGNRATADELLQEVWFTVSKDAPRFEPKTRFVAWLFSIAYKRVADSGVATGAARDQATALTRTLGQLPREQREAFLLQMEGELTLEEIASITNSSSDTIKTRLRLARAKLHELLSEHL